MPAALSRRRLEILALALLAVVFAWPMQINGYNQTAHYALVKALARGTATIDETRNEVGDLSTGDIATHEGHYYAVKAPGLAMTVVPAYLAIDAMGMRTTGDPTRAIWILNLFGSVLPALVLVAAVGWLAGRLEPGFGVATAVALGIATLVLPFATLFFAHVLPTMLAGVAFVLLWRVRRRALGPLAFAFVGAVAGLGIVADYSSVPLVLILGAYCVWGLPPGVVQRAAAYSAGVVAGVLPLLAFNWWAFGSLLHTPYADYWRERGQPLEPTRDALSNVAVYLFSTMGLLVLAPILVAGAAGLVFLYRRGDRAEALTLGAVVTFYLAFHSGNGGYGGLGPPRYLTIIFPFVIIPMALAFRRYPLTTAALALVSAFQMVLMTATGPLAAYDGRWLDRASGRMFMSTAATIVDVTSWYTIAPYFVAAVAVVAVAAASLPRLRWEARDAIAACLGLLAWALLTTLAPNAHGAQLPRIYGILTAVAVGSAVALWALVRGRAAAPGALYVSDELTSRNA